MFILLLLCFFLSGFAALVYETTWAREFEFVFGTSELAVVSILAAYMGGLAVGSAVAGRIVTRIRRPVLWYGLLELGIAASALAVPWAIRAATWLQTQVMGGRATPPAAGEVSAALFYVAVAFVVLLIPTGLMGATLPLLARYAVRRDEELGRRVGTLYAINTLGAVAGTVTTAFLLLPSLGLRSTVLVGAAANALVFVVAALVARSAGAGLPAADGRPLRSPAFHWVLPVVAVSGAASFTYEVLWTRLVGQLVGGTLQGFATMLASFLLGIAIGSAVAARLARDASRAAHGLAIAQLGAALLSTLAFVSLGLIPRLASALGAGHAGAVAGNAAIAALLLLPGSLCLGAVFPFAVRLLARDETEAGPAAARVYVWNTFGSIAGALASGFLLLPALRFEGTLMLAAGLNLALALAAAAWARPVAKTLVGLASVGLALLLVVRPPTPWGVLRHSAMVQSAAHWSGEVAFYAVGRSSTVLLVEQPSGFRLTTNGLPESVIQRRGPQPADPEPARWLGMLPVLLRPDLRDMLVIGLGGGLTVAAVPSSVETVTVIELEDEVVQAHEWLASRAEVTPIHDPRVNIVVNDARGALQLTDQRFGAIVSQPSHPWTAGASHLYTRDFFSLVAAHLEPGGVFVQWIGLSFIDRALLRSLVASLLDAFPHVALFAPVPGAVLFAASDLPFDPVATSAAALAATPADFARFGLHVPEDLVAGWVLDGDQARDFAGSAVGLSDDDNPLATRSALLSGKVMAVALGDLFARYEPLRFGQPELDPNYLVTRIATRGSPERALRLAQSAESGPQRLTAVGWARSVAAPRQAASAFRTALAADPSNQSARFGLLRAIQPQVVQQEPKARALAEPLEGAAAAVVKSWVDAARGEWDQVRARETALAGVAWRDPSSLDALRLRIRWRLEGADPAAYAEATTLATELIAVSVVPADVILAARALARSERHVEALRLIDHLSRTRRGDAAQGDAVALLEELRPKVDAKVWEGVERRLKRDSRREKRQP